MGITVRVLLSKFRSSVEQSAERPVDRWSLIGLAQTVSEYVSEICSTLVAAHKRWQADDGSAMAASVAYYLALSLFPMLLLLIAGVGLVMRFTRLGHDAEVQILSIVAEHCSTTLETQFREVLAQLRDHSVVGGPFGLATAILAAIGVFYQFERAFDKIWRIPTPAKSNWKATVRRLVVRRCMAFTLFTGVGCAIICTLAANVAIGTLRQWMSHLHLPGTIAITLVDATATMLLNAVAFGVLYRWLPKRRPLWSDAFRGGLLVSVIWEIGRQFLGAFLIGVKYTTAYGAIGSFIALLLWFYWGVTILFFGAEYVKVLSRKHQRPIRMFQPGVLNATHVHEVADPLPSEPDYNASCEPRRLVKTVPRRVAA
jgi:membrane protein